jgi:lysophospholipase L1-like esterase
MRNRGLTISLALNFVLLGAAVLWLARRGQAADAAAREGAEQRRERLEHLASLRPAPGGVVFLGDSLTERAEWAELLGDPRALNRGVAGDTVADALARAGDVAALAPARVLVMLGTNDVLQGAAPQRIAAGYAELLDALAPHEVLVQTVPPVGAGAPRPERSNEAIVELNRLIAELARARGIVVVDVHARLAAADGRLDPRYSADGVHLNGQGYLAWRAALLERWR